MIKSAAVLITLALTLPASAFEGVYGVKGNDTGGIIPWSPAAERMSRVIAENNCNVFGKHAVFRSMRRNYGEYIVYGCVFPRPLFYERRRVVLTAKG